jgi:hypothetical protein
MLRRQQKGWYGVKSGARNASCGVTPGARTATIDARRRGACRAFEAEATAAEPLCRRFAVETKPLASLVAASPVRVPALPCVWRAHPKKLIDRKPRAGWRSDASGKLLLASMLNQRKPVGGVLRFDGGPELC